MGNTKLILFALFAMTACATVVQIEKAGRGPSGNYGGQETPPGLTSSELADLEHLSEGSDIYPYEWIKALRSATFKDSHGGSTLPFFSDLDQRFGILPSSSQGSYLMPYAGITAAWSNQQPNHSDAFVGEKNEKVRTVNGIKSIKMVGTNCVICHSGEVRYQNKSFHVEGAPNIVNIRGYFQDLALSTITTLADAKALTQFLSDLNVPDASAQANKLSNYFLAELGKETRTGLGRLLGTQTHFGLGKLSAKVTLIMAYLNDRNRLSKGSPAITDSLTKLLRLTYGFSDSDNIGELRNRMEFLGTLMVGTSPKNQETISGFGRTDAFGRIGNLILRGDNPIDYTSPVSLPWIWGIKYMAMLHYTANTNSVMLRNIGQSLGLGAVVFGDNVTSTVNVYNIDRLEHLVDKIKVPYWEEMFANVPELKVDQTRAENIGKGIYESKCARCHMAPRKTGPTGQLDEYAVLPLAEIGTDPMAARNVVIPVNNEAFRWAILDGTKKIKARYYSRYGISNEIQAQYEFRDLRGNEFFRDTLNGYGDQNKDGNNYGNIPTGSGYKARHLAGVWATGPFLHNGSVPTIWDLLQPANKRPKYFNVKSRELDPVKLGFRSERPLKNGSPIPCTKGDDTCFDTFAVGNSNQGHSGEEFGVEMNDDDKKALIEYLKILPPEPEYSW